MIVAVQPTRLASFPEPPTAICKVIRMKPAGSYGQKQAVGSEALAEKTELGHSGHGHACASFFPIRPPCHEAMLGSRVSALGIRS